MSDLRADTIVDGRYRLLDRIGSGGMADVYAAEDTHLGRQVALKMLHQRFARDESFVERFRREASAAAKLQHPHVVGVFDRGAHDGTYYIAMEHLRGRSLKELVVEEGPLPQERAIDIALQVLDATGFAHDRGVIHRDLKPQNVIVRDDGQAKVTDFGIARAGASEMTETGSILGTAHYLSPEQAQGTAVGEPSDLYSIGVVLYEMLTGRLPFEGDSAVSIALKHVTDVPPPPSTVREDIDPALEAVVLRALEKDPARRFGSAAEFADALRSAREAITQGGEATQRTTAFAPVGAVAAGALAGAGGATAATAIAAKPDGPPAEAPPPEDPEEERRRRWPWMALALLALALLGVALWAALRSDGIDVPRVVGQPLGSARATLERAGFEVAVDRRADPAPAGRVLDQDPDAGTEADRGSTVRLAVSAGPATRTVPDVRGFSDDRATRVLSRRGFRVETEQGASSEVERGFAITTRPSPGSEARVGARVVLVVSTGPRQVEVPNVVGLTQDSAEDRLSSRGFGVRVVEAQSDKPKGEVIAQRPGAGNEVDEGTRVTISVSTGPPPEPETEEVPSVLGATEGQARRDLQELGFRVDVRRRRVTDPDEDGRVIEQRPSPGTELEPGSTVVIVVGKAPPPREEEEEQPEDTDEPQPPPEQPS